MDGPWGPAHGVLVRSLHFCLSDAGQGMRALRFRLPIRGVEMLPIREAEMWACSKCSVSTPLLRENACRAVSQTPLGVSRALKPWSFLSGL